MLAIALIATFVATVMTGPAGREWLERRRERRVRELAPATVLYLASTSCREQYTRVDFVDTLDV